MPELPGPKGQHLHQCPPRDLVVVDGGDVPPRSVRMSIIAFREVFWACSISGSASARSLPWFAHGVLNRRLGNEAIDPAGANTLPWRRRQVEQGRGKSLLRVGIAVHAIQIPSRGACWWGDRAYSQRGWPRLVPCPRRRAFSVGRGRPPAPREAVQAFGRGRLPTPAPGPVQSVPPYDVGKGRD